MTKPLMTTVMDLTARMEALAALGAHLRGTLGDAEIEPRLREPLARIAADLDTAPATELERRVALGSIRAFFRQAHDLLEHPERACGWTYEDPIVLDAQGRTSMTVADAIARAAPTLSDLDARLRAPGARFLDLGSGVSWLSIALARHYATLHLVGIDVWKPSLAVAARNIAQAGLADRIETRERDVTALGEADAYDGAWIPGPFLPRDVCERALGEVHRALRPGGWAFLGLWGGLPDPLALALADLRALRAGGHPWLEPDAKEALARAGFVDVGIAEHGLPAPVRLVVGRRAP